MPINQSIIQPIIDTIPNPIIILDDEKILMANENFLEFFEVPNSDNFIQKHKCICNLFQEKENHFSLCSIDENTSWTDYILNSDKKHKVSIRCKNNNSHIFNLIINKIEDNYLVVFTNITAKEENKSLKDLAYHDYLTQIYNRQMFDKLYKKELENKKRYGDALSLIMLDIDYFKEINDTYGHDIGDKVLITLTQLVSKHLRTNDVFARWGGEEFLILMPRTDKATAYQKAQELRRILDDHNNKIPHFTASFGVTEILDDDKKLSAFIRVDKALYQAKVKRNDVVKI